MSASPVFSSAAPGRHFFLGSNTPLPARFREMPRQAAVQGLRRAVLLPEGIKVAPASRLEVRPTPEMVSSGVPELDLLTGGWPRGCLSEICGAASSGRTSVTLAALAQATQRGEACALVDASDAMDPASAEAAGVEMGRMLWIRCGKKNSPRRHGDTEKNKAKSISVNNSSEQKKSEQRLEQFLKVTDLLLQSNGFGMIVLDLADIPVRSARKIPLASWFRFRRVVENTATVLLVVEQQPIAGSCSSVVLQVVGRSLPQVAGHRSQVSGKKPSAFSNQHAASGAKCAGDLHLRAAGICGDPVQAHLSHAELLGKFEITAELLRSRLDRKPAQAVTSFRSRAKWAG